MNDDSAFIEAIKQGDLDLIRSFPKSDLHNHFVLGGCREYILSKTGYDIEPIESTLSSMYVPRVLSSGKFSSFCARPTDRRNSAARLQVLPVHRRRGWLWPRFFLDNLHFICYSTREVRHRLRKGNALWHSVRESACQCRRRGFDP